MPEGFERFDRVVVDEVQDLTLLETAVVVELCRAIARARGRAPWLLMAGDSGQTVRPTGFEWGPLNDLLVRRVRRPEEFHLEDHLRCPSRIAEVIERASQRYTAVEKEVRPTRQRRQRGGQHVDAQLVHVHLSERSEAVRLLERLDEADDVVVVSPRKRPSRLGAGGVAGHGAQPGGRQGAGVPVGLRARSGPSTLHLGAGEHAVRDRRGPRAAGAPDVDRPPAGDAESGDGDAGVRGRRGRRRRPEREPGVARGCLRRTARTICSTIWLIPMRPAEERVLARTNDARELIDSAPRRAWQRACQAVRLLGDPDLPNGVGGPDIHTAPYPVLAKHESRALQALEVWSSNRTTRPFALLEAARRLVALPGGGGDWLRAALPSATQALRDGLNAGAVDPESAVVFAGADVEGWLRLTGYAGDASGGARVLRGKAFDALLKGGGAEESRPERRERLAKAESVLESIAPDLVRLGRLREAQQRADDAVDAYERAGKRKDVLRVLRNSGAWERAVGLARWRDPGRPGLVAQAEGPRRTTTAATEPAFAQRRAQPPREAARRDPEAAAAEGRRE